MSSIEQLTVGSAQAKPFSYELYRRLRHEEPIFRVELPNNMGMWMVTRYDDVLALFRDQRLVKDFRNALTPEQLAELPFGLGGFEYLNGGMLFRDPPDHTRLRALVSKAFTPQRVEQLRPRIQQIADQLLDAAEGEHSFDLLDAYAFPLPIMVISELLGVPHEDSARFRAWSNLVVGGETMVPGDAEREAALFAFGMYIQRLIEKRRAEPADDLISALIQANEQGDKLSGNELIAMIFLLIVAGHETTVNLIANGVLALLTHPEQLELLKRQPELIKSAVEEFLRFDGPVETSTMRYAREDLVVNGQQIRRGERVLLVIGSADRDAEHFERPDELDITREIKQHVAFGHGIHYCIGAPLARMEGQTAINTLLRRIPDLRLAVDPATLRYRTSMLIRGLEKMPVTRG